MDNKDRGIIAILFIILWIGIGAITDANKKEILQEIQTIKTLVNPDIVKYKWIDSLPKDRIIYIPKNIFKE